MRNEPKLRITHEAAKQLEKKPPIIKEAEKVRMEERAKKREFQEQLRHKRKEAFQAAKQADLDLHAACDEDDAAMKVQGEDQKKLHALKTSANGFKIEAEELDKKIKGLQLRWRAKRANYGHTKDLMQKQAVEMAIRGPKRSQTKVAEAYKANGDAWSALPRATVKKNRDRTAKKRAKVIRGRTSS